MLEQYHVRETSATLATTSEANATPQVEPPQAAQVPQVAEEETHQLPKSKRKNRTASMRYLKISQLACTYMFL
jgi:hypothetical protein